MIKKYAVPGVVLVLLSVATYFLFRGRSQAAWQFIPSNASAVVTSDRLQDSTFLVSASFVNLKQFPLINQANESLALLLWITRDIPIFERTLQKKNVTYSYHPRTSSGFGVIMYVPLADDQEIAWWTNPNRPDSRVLRHSFQGTQITDINNTSSKPVCSYIIKDKYLIVSQYGDLIEDVLRQSGEPISKFILQNQFEQSNDSEYSLNIYLNRSVWKNVLFQSLASQATLTEYMKLFPASQDYHLADTNGEKVEFKSLGTETNESYASSWLDGQQGTSFTNHRFISQQTSLFYRIASDDSARFKKRYLDWHSDYTATAWDKLFYHLGDQRQDFINNAGSEFILCQIEGNNSIGDGKLALIEYANYDKLRPVLSKLAKLTTKESNTSVGNHQGYDLYSVPIPELPEGLFGPLFRGFPRTFISYVGPYLVFSNSSQVLRNYISDYENQITWQQSPELDSVLVRKGSAAQLAMVASLRKVSSIHRATSIFSNNVESVVFECLLKGNESYPHLTILPKKRRTSGKVLNRTFLAGEITWKEGNDSLIAIATDLLQDAPTLLVTNEDDTLKYPTTGYDNTLPITSLDGRLITSPFSIDFLNIGRRQLVLATDKSLYAIDRDENNIVTPFRVTLPAESTMKGVMRIEGSNEGSSRFIVIDKANNFYLWNRPNQPPRKINRLKNYEALQSPIVAVNQLGSSSFIVTQNNGLVYLLKEDGTVRPGFPVDMLARVEGSFAWTLNPTTSQPEIVGVSAMGELVRVDMEGLIVDRKQLFRPESSVRFRTIFDRNSLDWLLLRISDTKAAILDKEGNEIFQIQDIALKSEIQYHYFGVDNRFISIRSGGFTSVFDMNGRRLGDKPIPSDVPVQIAYQPSYYKVFIFSRYQDKYQAWTIKIR